VTLGFSAALNCCGLVLRLEHRALTEQLNPLRCLRLHDSMFFTAAPVILHALHRRG
jgi:hypothetical protein